jgi:hypothetical protein
MKGVRQAIRIHIGQELRRRNPFQNHSTRSTVGLFVENNVRQKSDRVGTLRHSRRRSTYAPYGNHHTKFEVAHWRCRMLRLPLAKEREQTIAGPTIAGPTIAGPTIAGPTIAGPTIAGPTIAGPTIAGQTIAGQTIRW